MNELKSLHRVEMLVLRLLSAIQCESPDFATHSLKQFYSLYISNVVGVSRVDRLHNLPIWPLGDFSPEGDKWGILSSSAAECQPAFVHGYRLFQDRSYTEDVGRTRRFQGVSVEIET